MLPISCTMDLMEVSAPATQKPSQMMLDDVGAIFSTFYNGCGYHLKQELKVCVVPSVSCHCSHVQNQSGRPNCQGSLGCAVDRVSAQVLLLSIYTRKLRPGEKSCSSKVRQNWNVGSGTTVSESSPLASYCASRSANWIFFNC